MWIFWIIILYDVNKSNELRLLSKANDWHCVQYSKHTLVIVFDWFTSLTFELNQHFTNNVNALYTNELLKFISFF